MKKDQKKVTIIGLSIIVIAFLFYYFAIYPQTKAITSSDLNYVKSKCSTIGDKIYDCGNYFCIDSASGRCVEVDSNCASANIVYICSSTEGCTDTDGGQNYNIKGIVAYNGITYTDECQTPQLLKEYSCIQGIFTQETRTCECSNGVCVSDPICVENWQCSNWDVCVSNSQHRLCQDNNNCGTTNNKPQETQSCTSGGAVCGNSVCETGETSTSCPSDCQQVCLQVITKVCNPTTKEIKDYPNSCIPQGWSTNLDLCITSTFWDKIKEWFSNQTNQIITAVVVVIFGIIGVFYFTKK